MKMPDLRSLIVGGVFAVGSIATYAMLNDSPDSTQNSPTHVYHSSVDNKNPCGIEYDDLVIRTQDGTVEPYVRDKEGNFQKVKTLRDGLISEINAEAEAEVGKKNEEYNTNLSRIEENIRGIRDQLK